MSNPWIDISVPIDPENTPLWPGANKIHFKKSKCISKSCEVNDSDAQFNLHTATHIDAPLHFIDNGLSVDRIPIHKFIGHAAIYDFEGQKEITSNLLREKFNKIPSKMILLKTSNSKKWGKEFFPNFVGLTLDGAEFLVKNGIELIGNDYLSIQPYGGDNRIHTTCLQNNIIVLEGLRLDHVNEGLYDLIALPILFKDMEASPVRAVVRKI